MTTSAFDEAFEKVKNLAATFKANEVRYLSPGYQEVEVRNDFINPFLDALGWNVTSRLRTSPDEQEVHIEQGVETGAGRKKADYAFYLAPNFRDPRFFVEAKKPCGDIETADNYFQTIRYGFGSRTPLVALTNFAEFHVLDSRFLPDIKNVLNRSIDKYRYSDYADPEKFRRIYWWFSREAVASGALEKFAATLPKKGKGIPPSHLQNFDDAFLDELEKYRSQLAHAFKKRNPHLDSDTLTEVTQRTLDRLVFMRFLEDRLIEQQPLFDKFVSADSAWRNFLAACRRLDGIYNGIVFKEHPKLDQPNFRVDGEVFTGICQKLSHRYSPYDFNTIPIHILGSIYEQFLGKVIVATDKRVRVEDKPEVRKAGGVYYTPEYIVRYIVENTVGKLIAGKTPDQIAEMRFADIACGSGSFLLGMYDLLLTYHGRYYNDNPAKAHKGDCTERDGKLYLSLRKKRGILLNNIYGVDIDAQAVEVSQLSLYLKLLQNETTASAREHQLEFHETLLPSLNKNIVCGNSLIGRDILEGQLFPSDEERKLNPMNFEDAFPDIFGQKTRMVREGGDAYSVARSFGREGGRIVYPGPPVETRGFDAIVGNPPWVFTRDIEFGQIAKNYFAKHFVGADGKVNLYALFLERGIEILREDGLLSMIIPNTFLRAATYEKLRRHLITKHRLVAVTDAGTDVFAGVTASTIVLLLQKNTKVIPATVLSLSNDGVAQKINTVDIQQVAETPSAVLDIFTDTPSRRIMLEMAKSARPLADFVEHLISGIQTWKQHKSNFISDRKVTDKYKPLLEGKDIGRYESHFSQKYIFYSAKVLNVMQDEDIFLLPEKILIQRISGGNRPLKATLDRKRHYCFNSINSLVCRGVDNRYVLGLLNSTLLNWYYYNRFSNRSELTVNIAAKLLRQLPIPALDLGDPATKARHDEIVAKVEAMLAAKKELAGAKTDNDQTYYENKCAALDRQIDRLVYDLYGLSEDEIKIVESVP